MICTLSKHKAERGGWPDAMMLDWEGNVAECTGANIFFISDGVIATRRSRDCFLNGITPPVGDRSVQATRLRGDGAPYPAGGA